MLTGTGTQLVKCMMGLWICIVRCVNLSADADSAAAAPAAPSLGVNTFINIVSFVSFVRLQFAFCLSKHINTSSPNMLCLVPRQMFPGVSHAMEYTMPTERKTREYNKHMYVCHAREKDFGSFVLCISDEISAESVDYFR